MKTPTKRSRSTDDGFFTVIAFALVAAIVFGVYFGFRTVTVRKTWKATVVIKNGETPSGTLTRVGSGDTIIWPDTRGVKELNTSERYVQYFINEYEVKVKYWRSLKDGDSVRVAELKERDKR